MSQWTEQDLEPVTRCGLCGADAMAAFETRPDGLPLGQCRQCGFVALARRPTSQALKRYYDRDYFEDSDTYRDYFNYAQAVSDLKYCPRLERIARTRSDWKHQRVLEIGCAAGGTLLVLRHKGAEVFGVEISEAAAAVAQEKFDLEVFCGPVEAAPLAGTSYHAILAFDVLEHLAEPGAVLQQLVQVLLPGGILALTVPNFDRYAVEGMQWPGLQGYWEHLNYFASRQLAAQLSELGLTILDSHTFTAALPAVESVCHKSRELRRRLRQTLPVLELPLRLLRKLKFLLTGPPPLDVRDDAGGFDLFILAEKRGTPPAPDSDAGGTAG